MLNEVLNTNYLFIGDKWTLAAVVYRDNWGFEPHIPFPWLCDYRDQLEFDSTCLSVLRTSIWRWTICAREGNNYRVQNYDSSSRYLTTTSPSL